MGNGDKWSSLEDREFVFESVALLDSCCFFVFHYTND
jgi:hypothetical protein